LLDKISNVALIVMSTVVVGRFAMTAYQSQAKQSAKEAYSVGQTIADTGDLAFSGAPLTLLMVTQSHCGYCTASMPYYHTLTSAAGSAGARVVAVTPEDPTVNRAYLSDHQVRVDAVVPVKGNNIKYRGTPALIVVDRRGKVVKAWTGKLNKEGEAEVLSVVSHSPVVGSLN
jgi:peroxiredoxin